MSFNFIFLQTIRQENRITIILIVVVIVFLTCQMPTAIVLIYTSIHNAEHGSLESNILLGLGNIFNLLVAINASCNFLLYTALSDKYRKYFCAFFFCQRRKAPSNPRQFDGNPYELDTMDTTLRYALSPLQTVMTKKWHTDNANNCNTTISNLKIKNTNINVNHKIDEVDEDFYPVDDTNVVGVCTTLRNHIPNNHHETKFADSYS